MPARTSRPVALIILDGWGYREESTANAIRLASTPNWHRLWARSSRTLLTASGRAVGLPDGQMGNSEVGHLNLGAGRVVMQDLVRIGTAIEDGTFQSNAALVDACRLARTNGSTLHLLGLLGDGGVHGHDEHLFALVDLAASEGLQRVALHGLLDGRDTPPRSGHAFLSGVLERIAGKASLASLSGRYFGMDRDNRWERTEQWYRASVLGEGPQERDALAAVERAYAAAITDEFIPAMVMIDAAGTPVAPMRDGDVLIAFNFRSDRMRQTMRALALPDFTGFSTGPRPQLAITTMTRYDDSYPFPVAFAHQSMERLVGETIAAAGLTQLRIAETEKYPHVTFFFNGGRDEPYPGEDRQMVPSPKVPTYDLQPEMSADGVCDILCGALANRTHDFVLCNFANTDMVGHTGSLPAAIRAAEAVDRCLGRILDAAAAGGARLVVTADHGNADMMVDPTTGQPHTAHTTNPVPLVLLDPDGDVLLRSGGSLRDVGPTVLALLGVPRPAEMNGRDLRDLLT
ncbi:MAG TPA: 2,3-bisphosphoglycerate-independent phosphoglycerate mutase [Gemmatimonas sp.]|nr:2,3-bisphosphoglycerate-independent phosphoglycerate mutase [Gemmatimonas sp.]